MREIRGVICLLVLLDLTWWYVIRMKLILKSEDLVACLLLLLFEFAKINEKVWFWLFVCSLCIAFWTVRMTLNIVVWEALFVDVATMFEGATFFFFVLFLLVSNYKHEVASIVKEALSVVTTRRQFVDEGVDVMRGKQHEHDQRTIKAKRMSTTKGQKKQREWEWPKDNKSKENEHDQNNNDNKSKESEHDRNNNDNKSKENEHGQTTRTTKDTRKNKKNGTMVWTLWTAVKHNLNRSKGRDKAAREIETFIFQYLSITWWSNSAFSAQNQKYSCTTQENF